MAATDRMGIVKIYIVLRLSQLKEIGPWTNVWSTLNKIIIKCLMIILIKPEAQFTFKSKILQKLLEM